MFGLIVAGRQVDTAPVQTDADKFLFAIPEPESVNHFVVFLLGTVPLEPGYGAAVYVAWPTPELAWNLAGFLSNEKPSAIFRLGRSKAAESQAGLFVTDPSLMPGGSFVQIGISVEPLSELVQQTPATLHNAPTTTDLTLFSQRTVESLFNYACSFSTSPEQTYERLQAGEEFIPISVLNRWHESYLGKLARDPFFWRTTSSE